MTLRPEYSLGHSAYNAFLHAEVGEEANGIKLTVLTALTRLGVDPWQEAARLADLPRDVAVTALAASIARLPPLSPGGTWKTADAEAIAARLANFLPNHSTAPLQQPKSRARSSHGGATAAPAPAAAAAASAPKPKATLSTWLLWGVANNKDAYLAMEIRHAAILREHGATRVVSAWGEDVPDGKVTDYKGAVKATPDEKVVYAWIEWPSKAVRDAAWPKVMADPRMHEGKDSMPFDPRRMIHGGFAPILDV